MSIDPADFYIRGVKRVVRPAAAAVAGGFRGLQLSIDTFDGWLTLAPAENRAVQWETIDRDTGGYASTGTHTFGGITSAIGSAFVADAAGDVEVSGSLAVGVGDSVEVYVASAIGLNNFEDRLTNDIRIEPSSGTVDYSSALVIASAIFAVEIGDVVWYQVRNLTPDADALVFSRSVFTVKVLG